MLEQQIQARSTTAGVTVAHSMLSCCFQPPLYMATCEPSGTCICCWASTTRNHVVAGLFLPAVRPPPLPCSAPPFAGQPFCRPAHFVTRHALHMRGTREVAEEAVVSAACVGGSLRGGMCHGVCHVGSTERTLPACCSVLEDYQADSVHKCIFPRPLHSFKSYHGMV